MPGTDGFKVAFAGGQGGHVGQQHIAPGDAITSLGEGSREGGSEVRVPLH
jgi:hypothetical protein